jgi:hypothetical protein
MAELWGWVLGLLPGLIIAHHALYLGLIKSRSIQPQARGSDEHSALTAARKTVQSEAEHDFGPLALFIRLGLPAILTALVGVLLFHVLWGLRSPCNTLSQIGVRTDGLVAGAIGAYFWCLMELGQRKFRHDVTSGVAVWCAIQLALGPILGAAVLQVWRGDSPDHPVLPSQFPTDLVVAFLAGFAPRLLAAAARELARRLWLGTNALPSRTIPLTQIRGIDDTVADRLKEEGLVDVHMLAMANPVRLARNTPYDIRQIVAWIDEALLMYFLAKHWAALEENSITGAIDLAWEWVRYEQRTPSKELTILAQNCHVDPVILTDAAARMSEDTQVNSVWALYNEEEADAPP